MDGYKRKFFTDNNEDDKEESTQIVELSSDI